jgi:hypothetical protein
MQLPSIYVGMGRDETKKLFEQRGDAMKRAGADFSDTERIRNILVAHKLGFTTDDDEPIAQGSVFKSHDAHSAPWESNNITYSAIRVDAEIRLLTVYPGGGKDEIRCGLAVASLKAGTAFTALSYCWGSQESRGEILIDERKVSVTKSLEVALRHARDQLKEVVLWVDAISINQSNLSEKSSQVQMMGRVYANGKSPCNTF